MNPWLFPWWGSFKGPLSGNVTQDINPITSLLSPQLEFNFAGNSKIESEIVADVASFGKQLGILSEAVLELSEGNSGIAITKLKDLSVKIEKVKLKHKNELDRKIRDGLDQLQQQDPKMLQQLLNEYKES